jgi:hypothetical protein
VGPGSWRGGGRRRRPGGPRPVRACMARHALLGNRGLSHLARPGVHRAAHVPHSRGSVAPCTPWRSQRSARATIPSPAAVYAPTRPAQPAARPDPRRRGPPRPSRHGPVNVTRQTPALVRVTLTASDAVNVTQLGDRRFSVTFSGLHTASAPEGRVTRRESNCHRPRNGR